MSPRSSRTHPTGLSARSTDLALWEAICEGDDSAWEFLVRRYEALIYTIATRAGLSLADASDCFQQTWLSLYKNRRRITQPERLSAWLTTTAKREALRLRRRSRTETNVETLPELTDPQPLADAELEAWERRARLESALSKLEERCKSLLAALFLDPEDRSYDDIALELGIPRNSMGPVRGRCLEKLRAIIEDEGWA